MKASLLAGAAALASFASPYAAALAQGDQASAAPAGERFAPAPSVAEELVYLRDIIALQTLRLDEAEQTLNRQTRLIETQQQQIEALQGMVRSLSTGVPAVATAPAGGYVVKAGDTLTSIAQRRGVSVAAIAGANDLAAPYRLRIGQTLAIPGAAPAAQVQPQAEARPAAPAGAQPRVAAAVPAQERPDVAERAVTEQRRREEQPQQTGPEEVGVRPEEEEGRPYLAIFSDVGGILTPKGTLYAEPAIDYTVTSDNRFFFQGVEIASAILIGAIEATDSNRRAVTESLALRYGLTNRLEVDARIAYIQRNDRISGVSIDDSVATTRELDGHGLGDVEFGAHYQLNRGVRWPYAIANIRAKAPTGRGPFDVDRNPLTGVDRELATGSGYWSLEPSLTFILPTDPAVVFANFGYQVNMPATPDAMVGPTLTVREFDPGDAIRASIGVGLSLNERLSVNFGYDQSYFFSTRTLFELDNEGEIITYATKAPSATVGSFLFGGSYAVNDRIRLNLNTAFGATDEAPDMRVSLRAQFRVFD